MQPAEPARELHDAVLYVYASSWTCRVVVLLADGLADLFYQLSCPQLSYVAEVDGRVVGYILARM